MCTKVRNWEDMEVECVKKQIFTHRTPMAFPFGFYLCDIGVLFSCRDVSAEGFWTLSIFLGDQYLDDVFRKFIVIIYRRALHIGFP